MPTAIFIEQDGSEHRVAFTEGKTLMRVAVENDVPGIVATCGGSLSCASCHVYVDDNWGERAGCRSEEEDTLLEFAIDPLPNSRLSCQIVLNAALDGLTVRIPKAQP